MGEPPVPGRGRIIDTVIATLLKSFAEENIKSRLQFYDVPNLSLWHVSPSNRKSPIAGTDVPQLLSLRFAEVQIAVHL
ncbi:hypothetical protein TNCV_425941 [Trichonephila clavipes]|nr:hypothetical protein TNCV_425941 [Trichonephila clavipes]